MVEVEAEADGEGAGRVEVWWWMWIGEAGGPHGVVGCRVAACVRFGRAWRPVPPIIAMRTGSVGRWVC